MTNSIVIDKSQLRLFRFPSLFFMLFAACLLTSCTEEEPEVNPDTFIYLVTLNEEPDLQSLTIVDSLNGLGSMVVLDIQAHISNSFDLIIDRVDEDRANISASQPQNATGIDVTGAGFFTSDSVYLELTIDGFSNRDILSGSR